MTKIGFIGVSATALIAAGSAFAQDLSQRPPGAPSPTAEQVPPPQTPTGNDVGADIIVTAQRQDQRLQDVPIAVSAFSARSLQEQQIKNASDLQLTLPNVQFTKTNFTTSSFTIRGIGDLCVGFACDAATAIHLNGEPLFFTRTFETEYFDLERIEVLRGPQGTLFGRNATAGVVNIITAKPGLTRIGAAGEFEYGNYNSKKVKGMINLPLTDTIGVRVSGLYLNRDGYTRNLFNNTRVDDRDLYSVRGTLRFQPTPSTTLDVVGSYFHEDDKRLRIQKHLCQSDPTGVLACLAGQLTAGISNGNGNFTGGLSSREFLAIQGIPAAFGLNSLYGPSLTSGAVNPSDLRTINSDYTPRYFSDELQVQAKLNQKVGRFNLSLSATYQDVNVDASQDFFGAIQNRSVLQPALNVLAAAAGGGIPGLPASYFQPIAQAIIPDGPNGRLCTSQPEPTNTGSYGGHVVCAQTPLNFDRSNSNNKAYSFEGIVTSDFDGPFNFLLGGIYAHNKFSVGDYYVNTFGIDYLSGILGTFGALGAGRAPTYLASPFSHSNTDNFTLSSYGIFGETYLSLGEKLKFTVGLRYNNDKKSLRARNTIASFPAPFGITNAFDSPFAATAFDADPGIPGNQVFQVRNNGFDALTGRGVIDYQFSRDHLLYASYSRGYKSGGINPPLSPVFAVPETFNSEFINAYEIGSKNTFANGQLTLNLTGFYYQYNGLQLARLVARTSVNDNVDADIYGLEGEAVIRPDRNFQINLGASYLHTKITSDKFLSNPRDPGAGRADAVIIGDITNGSNCAVTSNVGSAAAAQGFVAAVNSALGLRGPTAFPANGGIASTGAFGICSVLTAQAASPAAAALGGITIAPSGILQNISGRKLPQSPNYKFSAGVQYIARFGDDYTLVPRFDLAYTGDFSAYIFNLPIDRVRSYVQMNAQIQFNGPDSRYFVRG